MADNRSTPLPKVELKSLAGASASSQAAKWTQVGVSWLSSRGRESHDPGLRPTVLLAGLMTSSILAAVSLVTFALLARTFFADEAPAFSILFITMGATVTTCLGSWASQPTVTRLVARHLNPH